MTDHDPPPPGTNESEIGLSAAVNMSQAPPAPPRRDPTEHPEDVQTTEATNQ